MPAQTPNSVVSEAVVADGLPPATRAKAVIAVSLSLLLALLDYAIANVALPEIAQDLHASSSASIWVVNAYQLASFVSLLPLAALGARVGYARLCLFGVVLFMASSVGCAMSTSLLFLSIARAAQGLAGACILSVNTALIRFIYPHAELGRGLALNTVIVGVGLALGPTVAGLVLAVATWPWLFWINIPLGALTLFLGYASLPRVAAHGSMPDALGALLCVIAFTALGLGADGLAHGASWSVQLMLLVAGSAALVALTRRESGLVHPILPVDLLRGPAFCVAFLTGLIGYVASNFFIISMPFTLHQDYGWSATATGLLMTSWAFGLITSSTMTRRLSDKVPASVLSSAGLLLTAVGFVALRLLPDQPGAFAIGSRIFVAAFGFGLFQVPNNRAMMLGAPAGREGGASGMVQVSRQGGQTLGAIAVAATLRIAAPNGGVECLDGAAACAALAALLSASRLVGNRSRATSG
ncbi:MFS transporter [Acetobacter sacchari]|uniref:MFS transporter n=1 Tax=Acetobacter sacchari TaxID=2661687 RepID=A0ABS3LXA9_9PROT|nr:MFS transporter [Acetobacter sacchari]MBO1360557.1 MFS transporter [Acetobacter sacchari]